MSQETCTRTCIATARVLHIYCHQTRKLGLLSMKYHPETLIVEVPHRFRLLRQLKGRDPISRGTLISKATNLVFLQCQIRFCTKELSDCQIGLTTSIRRGKSVRQYCGLTTIRKIRLPENIDFALHSEGRSNWLIFAYLVWTSGKEENGTYGFEFRKCFDGLRYCWR